MSRGERLALVWVGVLAATCVGIIASDHGHALAGALIGGVTCVLLGWCVRW